MLAFTQPALSWNPVTDVRQLLEYRFMVNAFVAGTIVARRGRRRSVGSWCCAARPSPATRSRSSAFPGAAGAVLVGLSASLGYFAFCLAAALVIAAVPRGRQGAYSEESAVIGTT